MMLDLIKKSLFAKYNEQENRGVFMSSFDTSGAISHSNGVLQADKPLGQLVELLYHGLLEKDLPNTKTIVVDIVINSYLEADMQKLSNLSAKEFGFCLVNNQNPTQTGVVLPNTKGVESVKDALMLIKQKYNLSGNVSIYVFKTDRIVVSK